MSRSRRVRRRSWAAAVAVILVLAVGGAALWEGVIPRGLGLPGAQDPSGNAEVVLPDPCVEIVSSGVGEPAIGVESANVPAVQPRTAQIALGGYPTEDSPISTPTPSPVPSQSESDPVAASATPGPSDDSSAPESPGPAPSAGAPEGASPSPTQSAGELPTPTAG